MFVHASSLEIQGRGLGSMSHGELLNVARISANGFGLFRHVIILMDSVSDLEKRQIMERDDANSKKKKRSTSDTA